MPIKIISLSLILLLSKASYAQELLSNDGVQEQIRAAMSSFKLPQQVDEITQVIAVDTLPVRGIQYTYQVDAEGGNASENEQAFLAIKGVAVQNLCSESQMIWYKQNFVDMEYIYLDRNGNEWYRFRINSNDC